jgi:polyisoprenoid-binding protein YceI
MDRERSQRLNLKNAVSNQKENFLMKNFGMASAAALIFASTALSATPPSGQILKITEGSVGFLAIGKPSAIKIRGKGTSPQGDIQIAEKNVTGEFTFDENSLNTGIELRDRHMKEKYLQTDKHPTAKFKITKLLLPSEFNPNSFNAERLPMEGELTLHGTTKPVTGTATIGSKSGHATGHIEFGTKITDYGIEIPTYMGVKVADQVNVDVDIQANSQGSNKK